MPKLTKVLDRATNLIYTIVKCGFIWECDCVLINWSIPFTKKETRKFTKKKKKETKKSKKVDEMVGLDSICCEEPDPYTNGLRQAKDMDPAWTRSTIGSSSRAEQSRLDTYLHKGLFVFIFVFFVGK